MDLHERRAEMLRRGYAAVNRRDVDAALELFGPGIEWPDMLRGGTLHGRDGVIGSPAEIAHGDELAALFVDQEVTELASGNDHSARVVHLWTFAGEVPIRMEVFGEREHSNLELFARFHEAQAAMYAGGDESAVATLLAPDAEWHVPGHNAIAGSFRDREEILGYFRRRRDLAAHTFRIDVRERLAADAGVVTLAHGAADLGGTAQRWGTAGVYRFAGGLLTGGWLLPTEQEAFDRIWA